MTSRNRFLKTKFRVSPRGARNILLVLFSTWLLTGGVAIRHGYEWEVVEPTNGVHSKHLVDLDAGQVMVHVSDPRCREQLVSCPMLFAIATLHAPYGLEISLNACSDYPLSSFRVDKAQLVYEDSGSIDVRGKIRNSKRGVSRFKNSFIKSPPAPIWQGRFFIRDLPIKKVPQKVVVSGVMLEENGIEVMKFLRTISLVPRYHFRIGPGWLQWLYYGGF